MNKEKQIAIPSVVKKAEVMKITNEKDMALATEILSQMNVELKRIVTDKEKLTKPLNTTLKEIRDRYREPETRLEDGIKAIRRMMTDYKTEADRVAQEKKDKIAARVGEGKGKLKHETAADQIEAVETASDFVETQSGSVGFRPERKCEEEDITKIPYEYLEVNMVMVRKAMKEGVEIPGIRYFTEQIPVNHR